MMNLALQLFLFLACLAGAAFFAASETALTSVSLSAWQKLQRERPRLAGVYALWFGDPNVVLATLLFGNMLASLGASILATAMTRRLAEAAHWPTGVFLLLSSFWAGATLLIAGEILPKLYARHYQDRVLAWVAAPLVLFTRAARPCLRGIAGLADLFREAFARRPSEPLITVEELRLALADPGSGELVPAARRILANLIAFDQVKVHEVMIPRGHIVAARMEQDPERVFEHIVRSGFSRIPVYFGNLDNILGIVYAKDLLAEWRSSGLLVLEDLLRPPYRIAPDAPLSVLLQAFRQGHHLAVVTDSFGRTQGVVTIEDAVEAIVGDIADEFDQPPAFV